jgi:hypothetical protein
MRTSIQKARIAAAAAAIGLLCAGFTTSAQAESSPSAEQSAAMKRADENCGNGEICFWRDRNYSGTPWRWTPGSGYRDMPAYLHDHVYSFKANANGCFIDWDPQEKRQVRSGDYGKVYDTVFGKRIDAVGPTC